MSEIIELEPDQDNPQTALLMSLKNDNFDEFKSILKSRFKIAIDINHFYGDPENKTLLDIACSTTDKAHYVRYLLNNGAKVNLFNRMQGAAPIHLAISYSDFDTVKLLVEHEDTDIYQPNTIGQTAFHLAVQLRKMDFIKLFQKRQATEIKLAKREILTSINTDKQLRSDDHETVDETNLLLLPKRRESFESGESLSLLLFQRNYEAFAAKANSDNVHHIDNSLGYTYLQFACKFGLIEFVELLLNLNVDPNETVESHKWTPIAIAAFHGYYDIVQLLLDSGIIIHNLVNGENILHSLMRGFYRLETLRESYRLRKQYGPVNLDDGDNQDYTKCLKLILDNVPDNQLNVDLLDQKGNTPLYYAIVLDNRDMILSLLERGAYIGAHNWNGEVIIKFMKPATLEYFLNGSITAYGHALEKHYNIKFNYNLLTCRQQHRNHTHINETKPLVALSEVSELKPLLKHPFFMVFLDFKWHIIMNKLVYINLVFYIQFVFNLSIYLLVVGYVASKNDEILDSLRACVLWYVIMMNNSIMLLRELGQLIIYSTANKYKYIIDPENWMEFTLIVVIYIILYGEIDSVQHRALLAAVAIFLSYVELMLLILSHPRTSVHIKMFQAVALNSLKFLTSYLILILAFTFSFYILFKDTNSKDNPFNNILQAIFKILVMSMGEYELSDILIHDEYGIRHLIVILFIFLISIVLFNLLNAIAVSDIQGIRKDAELVSTVARAKLIAHMEDIISDLYSFLDRLANYYSALVGTRSQPRKHGCILKQHYYTNYFATTDYYGQITYHANYGHCIIHKHHTYGSLKFFILPSTVRAIRERISAEASKEKIDPQDSTAGGTRDATTLLEVCKNQATLKNALERTENRLEAIELKFTEIKQLLNQKPK